MSSVAHVTFPLLESSSSISLRLSCSRFVMLICIHQQLRLFRLIPHWNRIGLSGSLRIGNEPPLQAHCALDNSESGHSALCHVILLRSDFSDPGSARLAQETQ